MAGFIDILRQAHGLTERSLTPESSTAAAPSESLLMAMTGGHDAGLSPDDALGIAEAYACVRVLADAVASIPLIVYRRSPVGRERVEQGIAAGLIRRPSPVLTQATLFATVMAHLQGWGNAYIAKFRGPRGDIVQLGVIHPARVQVTVEAGEPVFTVAPAQGQPGGVVRCNRRDLVHVKGMTWNGVTGVSPVLQARASIGLARGLETVAAGLMANGARPSGVLMHSGRLSQQAATMLKGAFKRITGSGAGDVVVLEEGLEYRPISLSPEDAQFVEQRKLSATQIARVFRVPPYMIGADAGSSMTYSNVEQETASFLTHSVRPWLVYIEQALNSDEDLFPAGGDTYTEFLVDAFLRSDARTRAEIYTQALDPGSGWMRRGEVRARENLDPETPEAPAPADTTQGKEVAA